MNIQLPDIVTIGVKPFVSAREAFSGLTLYTETNTVTPDEIEVMNYIKEQIKLHGMIINSLDAIAKKTMINLNVVLDLIRKLKKAGVIHMIQDGIQNRRTFLHITFVTEKEMYEKKKKTKELAKI